MQFISPISTSVPSDVQTALRFVEQTLEGVRLSSLQTLVFEASWSDRPYQDVAKAAGYEVSYVKQTGSGLWQLLSDAWGKKVTKRNLRTVLEQVYQCQYAIPEPSATPSSALTVPTSAHPLTASTFPLASASTLIDWGEAPDVSVFYGRTVELSLLKQWILGDSPTEKQRQPCRLVGIFAMGGMGKTALSVKLAQELQPHFEGMIWRSLRHAPLPETFLAELLQVLYPQTNERSLSIAEQLRRVLTHLRQQRILLILDNLESILQAGDRSGHYQPGYEAYGQLLHHVGTMPHQSTVILTSREKPKECVTQEGVLFPVRSLRLRGLDASAGQALCHAKGSFSGNRTDWDTLVDLYAGNPLALKLIAPIIQDCFEGQIAPFLDVIHQGHYLFGDIQDLLKGQFERLSSLEQQVMTWLAIHREPVALNHLRSRLIPTLPLGNLLEALASLERRSLIEKYRGRFTLQPAVMEYVTERLVTLVSQDMSAWIQEVVVSAYPPLAWPPQILSQTYPPTIQPPLSLHHYGLLQTQATNYLCDIQKRFIVQPIVERLLQQHRTTDIELGCRRLLDTWRQKPLGEQGYTGGNVINLLHQLPCSLQGWDFSNLRIWQADLRNVSLQQTNFKGADLLRSVFKETLSQILSVAFSPDGEYLVASDISYDIHVWRGSEMQPFRTLHAGDGWCWAIAISPNSRILAGSANGVIHLWDLNTGESLGDLHGSEGRVFSLAFSPDGLYLASGSEDHQIQVWDIRTRALVWQLTGHTDEVRSVAFAPQQFQTPHDSLRRLPPSPSYGHQLVSGSHDGNLKLWDLTTGMCLDTWSAESGAILSVAFSPDGQTLASSGQDHTIRIWDMATRQCRHILRGHQQQVRTVAFSPKGRILASGSDDPLICLWDATSGQLISTLTGHSSWISSLAFSPDGETLASGSEDQSVRLWNSETQQVLKVLQGHNNGVWSVALSPDGREVLSGGQDRYLRRWDLATGTLQQSLAGHTGWVLSVAYSLDGRWFVSGSEDRTVRLWDGQTGALKTVWDEHHHEVWSVAFEPAGTWVASGSLDGVIKIWNPHTNHSIRTLTGHTRGIWAIAISPDGKRLASGSQDRTVRLWDTVTGECLRVLTGHNCWIRSLAFSPDGGHLASSGSNGEVRLWDLQHQTHQVWTAHDSLVLSVSFSPDGQFLATCGGDRSVKVWDLKTLSCVHSLLGHQKWVRSLTFHPQGQQILSCSQDATIRVWTLNAQDNESACRVLRMPRPYEGMCITGATSLSEAQTQALLSLGARQL